MTRRLLVTGASGQLGRRVARAAIASGWRVTGTYLREPVEIRGVDWQRLDVRQRDQVDALVHAVRPDAVVHTAFLLAGPGFWTINADGAAHVARAACEVGARLIHISSDSIFDGEHAPYSEADPPSPITPYGASKAAAETAVGSLMPGAAIVRTSLIIDDDPLDNHSRMIMDIAAGRRSEALFTDEIRCPIAAADLAAAVIELIGLPYAGPIHVVGPDDVSRHELGTLVACRYGLDPALLPESTLAQSGLCRPANLRLDISRARDLLATPLRGVHEFLSPVQPA